MNPSIQSEKVTKFLIQLQLSIQRNLDKINKEVALQYSNQPDIFNSLSSKIEFSNNNDGQFLEDAWQKPADEALRGYGKTIICENGALFERAGIGFSSVAGDQLPPAITTKRRDLNGCGFQAQGVSVVCHPFNPYCPTVHFNVRYFEATRQQKIVDSWFGGGMDLTPYYGYSEDAKAFHQCCADALYPFGSQLYPQFKKNCDDYFFLKHRNEPRGIGGIFFDNFNLLGFEQDFKLVQAVSDAFLKAYPPLLEKRSGQLFGMRERNFQAYRRARYVEFNLIFDRGTHFGLQTGGRTESILLSMPPSANWRYRWQPEKGSAEAELYEKFLVCRDWLSA